jgi:hypothetical protein
VTGDAEVSAHDLDEVGIALGGPDRSHVPDEPEQEPSNPEAQANSERCGERAVDDGYRTWRTAHEDGFGQRAMYRRHQAWDLFVHQITTPPPNEKNDRKKLDAAKAIDKPKTIWISLRKPPEVSPNASDNPVLMMMMTAMILATGPWTDCRIWLSGCSYGMLEPAAKAGLTEKQAATNTVVERGGKTHDWSPIAVRL